MAGIESAVEAARRYIIKRPRLTRLLDNANARVLMLIAPAGFGKTTLAREWVADRPHVWYRGTTATADVAALSPGSRTSSPRSSPTPASRTVARMRATGTPEQDVDILAELFAEDLADWPDDPWLVFDDYQFAMEAEAPERFVDVLLAELPGPPLADEPQAPDLGIGAPAPVRRGLRARTERARDGPRRGWRGPRRPQGRACGRSRRARRRLARGDRPGRADRGLRAPEGGLPTLSTSTSPRSCTRLPRRCPAWPLPTRARPIARRWCGRVPARCRRSATCLPKAYVLASFRHAQARRTPSPAPHVSRDQGRDDGQAPREPMVERLARHLADTGVVGRRVHACEPPLLRAHLFVDASRERLHAMLDEARLATLASWLELGRSLRFDAPIIDLAEAEISFSSGDRLKAEDLAYRAARRLTPDHALLARAHYLAGLSGSSDI